MTVFQKNLRHYMAPALGRQSEHSLSDGYSAASRQPVSQLVPSSTQQQAPLLSAHPTHLQGLHIPALQHQ